MLSESYKKRLLELSGVQAKSNISANEAARIASEWHGGQDSNFYSLASTARFYPQAYSGYMRELKQCQLFAAEKQDAESIADLAQLEMWLKMQAAKYGTEQLDADKSEGHRHMNNKMLGGYLKAALFTAEDESLYKTHSPEDFSIEAINDVKKNLADFTAKAGPLLDGLDPEQVGTDFYFTSNRHGVGFWDRDYADEEVLKQLTDLSHQYGERHCEMMEDGQLGFMEV